MASNIGGFTPGPWFFVEPGRLQGRQYKDWVISGADGHNWICLGPEWDDIYQEESQANARLIEAAPELLEVLVKCRRALATVWGEDEKRLHEIDAAIAKATGAQP